MTKESDRFESLWDKVFYNYESIADITIDQMNEMLAIYSKLKQKKDRLLQYNKNQFAIIKDLEKQLLQATDAVQKDKLQYYEKELSALHTKIDFLETELKDYKDTLKENTLLKQQIQEITKSYTKFIEEKKEEFCHDCNRFNIIETKIQQLKKENEVLKYNFEHWESMKLLNQQNTIERLQKENSELQLRIELRSKELLDFANEKNDIIDNLRKDLENIKEQRTFYQNNNTNLKAENISLKIKKKNLEKEMQELTEKNDNQFDIIKLLQKENDSLKNEIKSLENTRY